MNDSQKYFHVILLIHSEYMEWTIRNNLYLTLWLIHEETSGNIM